MKTTKNKAETEHRLIKAVGEVLAEKGFGKIGVNAVARRAGVDKVLIYRYFSDLDGLMRAYATSADFWPSAQEIIGDDTDLLKSIPFSKAFAEVFRRYAKALRSRPLTLEILAWETIERNALTISLEEVRESMGLELMAYLSEVEAPDADWQAIANIFSGAIHYLAIRARKIKTFTGMDISDDHGWERLLDAMEGMVSGLDRTQRG